jgi:hypothetical protein
MNQQQTHASQQNARRVREYNHGLKTKLDRIEQKLDTLLCQIVEQQQQQPTAPNGHGRMFKVAGR